MNLQTQMAGQFSRQVSNQAGTSLPAIPHQQNMIQNSEGSHASLIMEPGFDKARRFIQDRIYEFLMQRQQTREIAPKNVLDIVRRLEEGLFKTATTKEEYMSLDTLETRLHNLIRRPTQRYQQQNNASGMGTMIPTPGVPQSGNMIPSSTDVMVSSSAVNPGSFSMNSQMMPTPGFNNTNNTTNNVSMLSNVDSTMVSQPQQQKQQVGGQNSRILHSLGSHMGGGIRSTLNQKTYGFQNGSLNSNNLGMMGKSQQMVNSLGTSEGFLTDYGNAPKPVPVPQYFDQHQGQMVNDGSGNFYVPATSASSMMNMNTNTNTNTNTVNLSALQKTNSPLVVNQSTDHQPANMNQSEEMDFRNTMHSQQPLHFQQQVIQPQRQQKQQNQRFQYGQNQNQNQVISDMGNRIKSEPGTESLQPPQVYEQFQSSISQDTRLPLPETSGQQQQPNFGGQQEAGQWQSRSQGVLSNEVKRPIDPPDTTPVSRSGNLDRELQFKNQKRWLLFLMHARKCPHPPGSCPESNCLTAQKLLNHISTCMDVNQCTYPRCHRTKRLLHHHRKCRDETCPVCVPVKLFVQQKGVQGQNSKNMNSSVVQTSEDLHPSMKRMKIEQQPCQSPAGQTENQVTSSGPTPITTSTSEVLQDVKRVPPQEVTVVKMEVPVTSVQESLKITTDVASVMLNDAGPAKQENDEIAPGTKSGKPKIKGVSMTELFTPEQVREHITGLRQWVGQSKAKVEKNQAMELSMNENSCQLCAVEKLNFEPPPIYCSPCGARIKRNAMFYTIGSGDTRHYFCIPCYNEARGDTVSVDGTNILKARLEKKKNDEETEEPWVQCDKCEAWQHQICALFNGRRNDGGQAEYTCPNCYMEEVENGERVPLPQSALLGAKDLPRTILSDHIENRLFKRLKQERLDRARFHGKSYDEVPGAESLVVRVVSSVDKKLEVKPRFLEIFQEENYPSEFAYKSKVVLLFQKIEGVEVCLFGMYVQEFGAECEQPNHRRVYLSYLDSVKYFRPEIRTVTGEALRTFVYHEILIGYLEYCKLRGFTSCYIWACPPLKGEDYILYCHPEIQKTPKSDKLREWYLSMLRKATKENIVVDLTNLYDHFFVSSGECKAKVTAARLPYFDGDYWPGAAEDIIYQLRQEEEGRKLNKKGAMKRTITKRALKASGQMDLSGNASKDLLLMHRLGETISPMKEDFIMVHLQHACTHCCLLMVSGTRWVCNNCKNFQLCNSCYEIEQNIEEREKHPINQRVKHPLYPVEIKDVATDTKDKDEILESEFFDTRQAFLSLCQGNHYQYDTLRRAKHSSMMALYHLHNPTAPAFVITCVACRLDIETGQGWRCEICPDYDLCNACYRKDRGIDHPHKLTHHPSIAERDAQNKEARQLRVVQLRKMLDLLVHAAQCRAQLCQYPNCRKVKGLFRHGMHCKVRASGGCLLCKKMWHLLQLHARACKDTPCNVPRCRDLREHLRRLNQQADSRRRAAVMEMMRQRAAEVAGGSG
ncbi:unnamed protein product [Lactuca virosa]|uniref:histone acetyltransferase n=1 Tax=Lactuca virosa TaxID=75947 RepID=A0AAU9PWM4_9ASTR|nr:unnamed protein product [Lactuca virosa]